jgi:benzoyl-CoA reductase subunit C
MATGKDAKSVLPELSEFRSIYDDPAGAARKWKERNDGLVVGYLGLDVPVELIIAAGILPVRISAAPTENLEKARGLVEGDSNPGLLALISRLIDGSYDYLDALVICSRPPHYGEIFNLLRELGRANPGMIAARLALVEMHHADHPSTREFNLQSIRKFKNLLEAWIGHSISESRISASISLVNESRRLLHRVSELRAADPTALSGVDGLKIIGSSEFIPRERHNALLNVLFENRGDLAPISGMRILYSGSDVDQPQIYELIEDAGTVIVAGDHDRGSRSVSGLVDESGDPIEAIACRYQHRPPSSSGFSRAARIACFRELIATAKPDGVIFHIQASDHPAAWEYPVLRQLLQDSGIPQLELGPQKYRIRNPDGIMEAVRDFAAAE